MNKKNLKNIFKDEKREKNEYEELLETKTFEEMMEGYKRAILLIKKIDKEGFNEIKNCIKYLKAKCPNKLDEYKELLKALWEDQDNQELQEKVYRFEFLSDENVYENINYLKLFFGTNGYYIELDDWDMLTFVKTGVYLISNEKNYCYVIAPIFDEILDDLNDNIEEGYQFYSKEKSTQIFANDWNKEIEYTLYKDKDGKLKVNISDFDKEKPKTKTIKK